MLKQYGNYIPDKNGNSVDDKKDESDKNNNSVDEKKDEETKKILVTTLTDIQSKNIIAEDKKGNQVVVPGGFKVRADQGETVQDGIVIEDSIGNQFVWIPVSNINADGSNKIIKNDGDGVEITLARYKFTGFEMKQKGSDYTQEVEIDWGKELNIKQESNQKDATDGTNTTAKDLKGFIDSVSSNKGYYIARYEASFGSGEKSGVITNQKPYSIYADDSKINGSAMNYEPGNVWNFITQGDAAKVCRNMYDGNQYVTSDLINSYAWDTAIVYIQGCTGNSDYTYATKNSPDEICNIFNLSGRMMEWTTEMSTYYDGTRTFPCMRRGYTTMDRHNAMANLNDNNVSFRPVMYIN